MTATDGPYCPCGWHRVQAHGQLCPICLDDRARRTTTQEDTK